MSKIVLIPHEMRFLEVADDIPAEHCDAVRKYGDDAMKGRTAWDVFGAKVLDFCEVRLVRRGQRSNNTLWCAELFWGMHIGGDGEGIHPDGVILLSAEAKHPNDALMALSRKVVERYWDTDGQP